jgi:hypothetical protein
MRWQVARVGAFDFGNKEIGEAADAIEWLGIWEGLVDSVALEIGEGAPSDEVGRQTAFAVAGENGFKLPKVIGGVERVRKMSSPAKLEPSGKRLVREVEGEEVLKVVKGKEKVRHSGALAPVVGGALVVVAVVEIEVGPDANGDFFVLFADGLIALLEGGKFPGLGDGVLRSEYPEGRLEAAAGQGLLIEKRLQTLEVGPLGLSFANDQMACAGHGDQIAGCGMPA